MKLRAGTTSDNRQVAAIIGDWIAETPYIPKLHTRAEDRAFFAHVLDTLDTMVGETDAEIKGFIARCDDSIDHLYLARDARRQGLGQALLDVMKSRSNQLQLWCFQENHAARAFYEAQGFTAVKMTDGADNAENLPDILYRWSNKT